MAACRRRVREARSIAQVAPSPRRLAGRASRLPWGDEVPRSSSCSLAATARLPWGDEVPRSSNSGPRSQHSRSGDGRDARAPSIQDPRRPRSQHSRFGGCGLLFSSQSSGSMRAWRAPERRQGWLSFAKAKVAQFWVALKRYVRLAYPYPEAHQRFIDRSSC